MNIERLKRIFVLLNCNLIQAPRMKYCCIILISTSSLLNANAQRELPIGNNNYFFLGIGLSIHKIRDEAHSPLIYKGLQTQLKIGFENINQQYDAKLMLTYSLGILRPHGIPKPKTTLSEADLNHIQFAFAYYKHIGDYIPGIPNYFFGGALTFYLNALNYNLPSNNTIGLESFAAINIGGLMHNRINKLWDMEYELYTPCLSYGIRPTYVGMPLQRENFKLAKINQWAKWATFNKVFQIYSRLDADQLITDYRRRQFSYTWDYHYNTLSKKLQSVNSALEYESLIKM